MNRRNFVKSGSVAALSLATVSIGACNSSKSRKTDEQNSFELNEITIEELQRKMQNGELSSKSVVQSYIDQIEKIDRNGPSLHAVIEINPEAISIAESLDQERKAGKVRGPLHGIPILLKDNIDTADKMHTTAGSLALESNIASLDAFLVKQLRSAGAVMIGKTNLSEWANFRSTRSVSGWSSRGGQTKNPYILDRSPCGSSSGSAVAVAANLCTVSIGTETNGSIACPASMNAIVGIKPTVGLVSRSGIIPISVTQDTAGPFARTVTDAAIVLSAMAGADPRDPVTTTNPSRQNLDYTQFLDADALRGKRIGVEKSFLEKHEGIDLLLKDAIAALKSKGTTVVELSFMETIELDGAEGKLLEFEFKDGLNKYLTAANAGVKSLEQVIDFNLKNETKAMPTFKQETLLSAQAKGDLNSKEYQESLLRILDVRKRLNQIFENNRLDALCGPATGPSWCIDPVNGDFWTGYGAYGPAAVAGFPSITLPMGNVNELPVGISFLGKAYDEAALISIGYAYEQTSKKRTTPRFIETLKIPG
jgi:amidase